MSFFYDGFFHKEDSYPEKFSPAVIRQALASFADRYDPADDAAQWFDQVKEITLSLGFTTNMKEYKQDPGSFPGSVADVSTFLRLAVTGRVNSPDLYTVMSILGRDRTLARIRAAIEALS